MVGFALGKSPQQRTPTTRARAGAGERQQGGTKGRARPKVRRSETEARQATKGRDGKERCRDSTGLVGVVVLTLSCFIIIYYYLVPRLRAEAEAEAFRARGGWGRPPCGIGIYICGICPHCFCTVFYWFFSISIPRNSCFQCLSSF